MTVIKTIFKKITFYRRLSE